MMRILSIFALAFATASIPGNAATITGLVNTGQDNAGAVLGDNAEDLHWSIEPEGVAPHPPVVATSTGGFPIGPWLGDSADSAWVSYGADTNGPPINYTFSIPFSLTGLDVGTVTITGRWSSDNDGTDILINGVSTGQTNTNQFSDWSDFSISSAEGHVFNADDNVLAFVVNNAPPNDNPVGFRAEFSEATADVIPEPSALGLLLAGLFGLVARRRR